jgi:hypothetical protein
MKISALFIFSLGNPCKIKANIVVKYKISILKFILPKIVSEDVKVSI